MTSLTQVSRHLYVNVFVVEIIARLLAIAN